MIAEQRFCVRFVTERKLLLVIKAFSSFFREDPRFCEHIVGSASFFFP